MYLTKFFLRLACHFLLIYLFLFLIGRASKQPWTRTSFPNAFNINSFIRLMRPHFFPLLVLYALPGDVLNSLRETK